MNPANSAHMRIVYDPDREFSAAEDVVFAFTSLPPFLLRVHNGRHAGHTLGFTDFVRHITEDDSSAFRPSSLQFRPFPVRFDTLCFWSIL